MLNQQICLCFIMIIRGDFMDATLAIIILVSVMYFVIIIGAVIFILKKRKSNFKQKTDLKLDQTFKTSQVEKNP